MEVVGAMTDPVPSSTMTALLKGQGRMLASMRPLLLEMTIVSLGTMLLVLWFFPEQAKLFGAGLFLGMMYLFSVALNGFLPLGRFQIVFSLTRMMLFAYLIVYSASFNFQGTAVVIYGFLSYKLVLIRGVLGPLLGGKSNLIFDPTAKAPSDTRKS
jgi:hypothetical protein